MGDRLLVKITRENLPRISDRYPFVYLEYGRLEVDDSSVKWIDNEKEIVHIPVAMLNCIILGPGTSVTHEAVKATTASNCGICWGGEDTLLFYAGGISPTAKTTNFRKQIFLSSSKQKSIEIAKKLFKKRFPNLDVGDMSIKELMGIEGSRVQQMYEEMANKYKIVWLGRRYTPGKFELSDLSNQILTACNSYLYGIICSVVHSLGYTPYAGFIHSGSPLPFVYDMADLYKKDPCVDLAFSLPAKLSGEYNKEVVSSAFIQKALDVKLLENITLDIKDLFGGVEE